MKTLMINYEFPPVGGGAGRATWYLCQHLSKMGVKVDVLTSIGKTNGKFALGQVNVFAIPITRRSVHETGLRGIIEFLLRGSVKAWHLTRTNNYDLIHYFFSVPTGLLSFFVGRSIPYIVSLRGGDVPGYCSCEFQIVQRLLKPLNQLIWRRATAAVALSNDLGETSGRLERKIEFDVIYNGVDINIFRPLKVERREGEKPVQLLCVARLTEWKGIQYLLKAVDQLRHENIHLTIIGTGYYEQTLRRLSSKLDLEDIVTFEGSQPYRGLADIYNKGDIFVLPSYGDSFGQVYTEAMACGLPIVAARFGGVQEFVENGVNGFLVTARSADALADSLQRLINDSSLRRCMGQRNVDKVRAEFSWESKAAQYLRVYERCLLDYQ